MVRLNFIWKQKKGEYQQGDNLYLNKIRIASFDWNIARSRNDTSQDNRYVGHIELPSLSDTSKRVYAGTPEEIKNKIEQAVELWFTEALREEE